MGGDSVSNSMPASERENQRIRGQLNSAIVLSTDLVPGTHLLDPAIELSTHRSRMHASLGRIMLQSHGRRESRSWTAVGARWRRPWPGRCRRVRHSLGSRVATIFPESARQLASSQALPRPDLTPRRRTSASCASPAERRKEAFTGSLRPSGASDRCGGVLNPVVLGVQWVKTARWVNRHRRHLLWVRRFGGAPGFCRLHPSAGMLLAHWRH